MPKYNKIMAESCSDKLGAYLAFNINNLIKRKLKSILGGMHVTGQASLLLALRDRYLLVWSQNISSTIMGSDKCHIKRAGLAFWREQFHVFVNL